MKKQKNRVYYNLQKLAKTVTKQKDLISCIEIGTVSIKKWAEKHAINLDWMPNDDRPVQNRMFGVQVIWITDYKGAKIHYKESA